MNPRLRERLGLALRGLGLGAVFAVAAGVGLLLHVDLPPARRAIARNLESLLNDTFQGRFEIGSIEHLSSRTLRVSEVRVHDPRGAVVLEAKRLRVRADAIEILEELLLGDAKTNVVFQHVRIEQASVVIVPDPATGVPTLATAFALSPRMKAKPSSTTPSTLRVWFPTVELGEGSVRGHLEGTPSAEGHVKGVRGAVLVSPVGVAVDAAQFSTVLRVAGSPEVRGVASFHQRGTTHFYGTFDGYVGELQVNTVGRLDGARLDLRLDVPNAEPFLVRAMYPDWPVNETLTAHAELKGEIPKFQASGHFVAKDAIVDASGDLHFGSEPSARLAVTGQKVDLRAFIADSPPTSIDTQGEIVVHGSDDGVVVDFSGATQPTSISEYPVPAADFTGRYAKRLLEARGTLHEPGMPVETSFALTADGVVDIDARARRFRLSRAPRLHGYVPADAEADIHAKAHIEKGRLDARLDADVEDFAVGPVRVAKGTLHGRATGPLARPGALALEAQASGTGFRAGEFSFDKVSANVKGPLERLDVGASFESAHGPTILAKTKLRAVGGARFDDVDLEIRRDQVSIQARAASIDVREGSVEAKNVSLEGAGGTLTGSVRYQPNLFQLDARGEDVDLGAVSRVLGFSRGTLGGKVNVDAELVAASDVRKGDVHLRVKDGSLGPIGGVTLDLDATLDEDGVEGEATTTVNGYGHARASWDIGITGDLFERERWRRADGRFDLGVESFDLAHITKLLPPELRVREVRGVGVAQFSLLRASPDALPNLGVLVATNGLGITVVPEGEGENPIEITGIEANLGASVDGKTGGTDATLRLVDDHGVLASATGHAEFDLARIVARPAELVSELRTRELALTVLVDGRRMEKLPEPFRPKAMSGTLRAEATLRGTLAAPVLSLKAALGEVTLGDEVQSRPFDACLRAQYDPVASRFGLGTELYIDDPGLGPCAGRRVAIANAAGDFDLAAARAGKRAFRGDAQLSLEDLPLEFVTPLARARIAGRATGRAALVQSADEPQISASIEVTEATVRNLDLGEGHVELRSNGPDVRANVKLTKSDGSLEGEGRAGLDWEGLVPSIDRTRALSFTGDVRNVDAAVLQPLLEDVVAGLEGRLDGNVRLALVPVRAADGTTSFTGDVGGKASLENGSLQLAGLGMRLSALRFEAEAKKVGGRTIISVRKLSAASRSKNPNVSASADLYLAGLDFEGGRANVNVRGVPLMIQGSTQATLTGTATVELERRPDRIYALVKLPKMVAELPRSSGGGVLSVDANPDIEILQPIAEPTLRTSSGGLPWELEFELGRSVTVRRADLRVPIDGVAKVSLGKEVEVTGDIDLEPGGRVQLLGKGFVIEQGEVHFDNGDATNPSLRVLASWRAPDQTIVYVEVRGTFREASLRLQSDPARSEAEIQALLLGGGTNDSGEAQTAGVGYGADFVNELLADTNLPHVELRTGTESSGEDRRYQTYTAAVQISDQVWFEGSYKNLSTTETTEQGDAVSGTVDWRFKRDWSLRTEIGNIGTGVDLLWQYRY